jgi:CheY-like chemotaxis protein
VEIFSVREGEAAIRELSRSPAQALIVNAPQDGHVAVQLTEDFGPLRQLPYDTPTMICWVPGEGAAAKRLGVVRYLVKPIRCETLLSALEELGEGVQSVLLVDDEREVLQLFARMLSTAGRGYRILRARSGPQALSLLRTERPDVVLLDLIMPGMDGFQVLQEKERDPAIRTIPVVVVSSRDPDNEPIVSNKLTITRNGGLSVRDLLACMRAVSEILVPSVPSVDRGRKEKPAA